MHKEILSKAQIKLLLFLKTFSDNFGLVEGSAVALHVGHRQSIDFDLFTNKKFDNFNIQKQIKSQFKIDKVLIDQLDEYTIVVKGVKFTFLYYPFKIKFTEKFNNIKVADLLTLSALKAYALGRRSKWKDYVDLYFIINEYFSILRIIKKAKLIFGDEFNEKIFRTQLTYFKDIDHSEKIIYLKGHQVNDKIIENKLTEFSLME